MALNWSMSIRMNHSGLTARLLWVKYEGNTRLCTPQMNGSKLRLLSCLQSNLLMHLLYSVVD